MSFRIPALKELTDQQVRFAPAPKREEQLGRAIRLLGEIEPKRYYPYQFVCYRLTEYRPEILGDLLISGVDLSHDLELIIHALEKSLPARPVTQEVEALLSLEDVSRLFNVSSKTITRWKARGLLPRRIIVNGRRQLGFPRSVVEKFREENAEIVSRASDFSRLDNKEKLRILYRANRLARAGGDLTEVCKRIANKLGRSVEAVRYTIKNHDRQFPDRAIFPVRTGRLDWETKEKIHDDFEKGVPMETLVSKYDRSRSAIYQAVHEVQFRRLLERPVEYIHNKDFENPENDAIFLAPMPGEEEFEAERAKMGPPKDVPADMAHLYMYPLLTKEQEQHLFRQMNYLKYKLNKLRETINPSSVTSADLQQVQELYGKLRAVRDRLIQCNTRLVASIAKKHSHQIENMAELMSDGSVSLMRAVEKFDYSRGNKFSTYATWAIMKNFARSIPDEIHYRERYITGSEEMFETKQDARSDEQEALVAADQARARINKLLESLDPRTREVIRMRNGLDGNAVMTLEQIGQHFGITKERVRQINVRGMKQLKEKAAEAKIDLP